MIKVRHLWAVLLVTVAGPTFAGSFDLGTLSVPSLQGLANTFQAPTSFVDSYNFNVASTANADGLLFELDPWLNTLEINIDSVTLLGGAYAVDFSPTTFNFGGLVAGTAYSLVISGSVTREFGLSKSPVGYAGLLSLTSGRATSVPEPGTLALFGVGLIGVALAARRRRLNI